MKLSTRGRYGLRVMIELALHNQQRLVMMREIATEQKISRKYIHNLLTLLKAAGLVRAERGACGGFKLDRAPENIRLGDLIEVLEGGLTFSDCVANPRLCRRADRCAAREVWESLSHKMREMLNAITLADLARRQQEKAAAPLMFYI